MATPKKQSNDAYVAGRTGKQADPIGSLTTYLREKATPEEKAAYRQATPPGSKAGTAPKTIQALRALVSNPK